MTNLVRKIIDIALLIKKIIVRIIFGIYFFIFLLSILYLLKSAIGINIFKDMHVEDVLLSIKDFFGALFSIFIEK
jgi:hypothetical protein